MRLEARRRTVEGREEVADERARLEWVRRVRVMVVRQSTTVPKTSKRRALGGWVRDMDGLAGPRRWAGAKVGKVTWLVGWLVGWMVG